MKDIQVKTKLEKLVELLKEFDEIHGTSFQEMVMNEFNKKTMELSDVPDGEWSGEVLGPKIQGNPLNLDQHIVVLFSLDKAPVFENVPIDYEGLKEWLPKQKSKFGKDCGIEGIVWHTQDGDMFKIKVKDFTGSPR